MFDKMPVGILETEQRDGPEGRKASRRRVNPAGMYILNFAVECLKLLCISTSKYFWTKIGS